MYLAKNICAKKQDLSDILLIFLPYLKCSIFKQKRKLAKKLAKKTKFLSIIFLKFKEGYYYYKNHLGIYPLFYFASFF